MLKPKVVKRHFLFILFILLAFIGQNLFSQPVVGLDNTNTKTGKPFH
jgi:hypothetical protein